MQVSSTPASRARRRYFLSEQRTDGAARSKIEPGVESGKAPLGSYIRTTTRPTFPYPVVALGGRLGNHKSLAPLLTADATSTLQVERLSGGCSETGKFCKATKLPVPWVCCFWNYRGQGCSWHWESVELREQEECSGEACPRLRALAWAGAPGECICPGLLRKRHYHCLSKNRWGKLTCHERGSEATPSRQLDVTVAPAVKENIKKGKC